MKSKLDAIKAANPILEIQFYLRDISQHDSDIPSVFPTGRYDAQTQESVNKFQKKHSLPVTGRVDFATWSAIVKEHKECLHCVNAPNKVCCFPENKYEYKLGDSGNLIYILQSILSNFQKKYSNYPSVQLTGIFDEQTEQAINHFQKCSHLPVTGVLDRKTWNVLNKINEVCKMCE